MVTPVVAMTGTFRTFQVLNGMDDLSSEVVAVEWKIPHFDKMMGNAKMLDKQRFELVVPQGSNRAETKWTLFLSCPEEDEDTARYTGVFHVLKSRHPNTEVYTCLRILIKSLEEGGNNNNNNGTGGGRPFFDSKTDMMRMNGNDDEHDVLKGGWGYQKVIKFGVPVPNLPLRNGVLTINLELTVFTPNDPGLVGSAKSLMAKQEELLSTKFAADMTKLQASEELSDVKIVTMEGNEHLANKTMLSARSPVFARMFKTNLNEAATGVVKLEDISSDTMLTLLQYIYAGKLSVENKTATDIMDLVYAADKYDLEDLRQFCDEVLCTKWNQLSAAEGLEGAKKFRLTKTEAKLKEHVKQSTGR